MTEEPFNSLPQAIAVRLLETATGNLVALTLRGDVSVEDLERIESLWSPARLAAVEAIAAQGRNAEHRHWNWAAKSPLVANNDCAGLIIELDGMPQGVLLYSLASTAGRVGLHALPQAETFYERLGMTKFEPELEHEGLAYFEISSEVAADWELSE
jgi:hypothetical protein